MRRIGKRGAKTLDAAEEGTTRLDNLNVAREMEQAGKDVKAIRLATGWERGVDGKWRHEIPDGTFRREGFITNPDLLEFRELERKFIDGALTEREQARLEELKPVARQIRKPSRLSDFYDAPELYAAYPELADVRVEFQGMGEKGKGAYSPAQNVIILNAWGRGEDARTALVHEIQHAIQNIEGFARGGSPKGAWLGRARDHTMKFYKELRAPMSLNEYAKNAWQTDEITDEIREDYEKYLKIATSREADLAAQEGAGRKTYHHLGGEVEARNVEKRTLLTDKERKERLLAETEDVAREDQIILEGMMGAYSEQQPEIAENIRRGQAAMEKVISEQTDVMDAMHRDDLGSISFLWGEPGDAPYYMNGSGISHILAKRSAEGMDAEKFLMDMVEVIANGDIVKDYTIRGGRPRINIAKGPITAVLGKVRNGEKVTWVVTGWDERVPPLKKPRPDTPGRDQGLPGATLSETTPSVTEREQSEASDNSKPPVVQKSKRESTPNGRTYFLPDGTSIIDFFETANKSTSFHEFGHHVFNKMVEFSGREGVDPQMAKDVETILKEAHVSRKSFDADIKNARKRAHEFFARGFEKYLAEGKAPTKTLRDVFRRIRNWMIEVYERIANIPGKQLSDEMRGVYNRLFASDGAFGDIYGAEDVKAGTNDPAQTQEMVTTTTRKGVEVVMRRASRPAWRTAETDAVAEELERKMLAVGKDREEARAFARVGASVAGMLARRANISPADAMRLTLRRGEDARQGEGFAQPANAGVDLGQKVPVLDLSGAEGTSTTKELLTRLKDLALKDETWISRDAEVFATLPKGKKLKHVAYSSRMPGSREARALRSNIASGMDELVQNAVLIESVPNNDPKKTDILNFHRLYVPVRTDAGIQAVRIVAEELKESDRLRPTDVELYDVVLEGQKESPAVSHGLLAEEVVPSPGAPSEITIADMLRGVKDADGTQIRRLRRLDRGSSPSSHRLSRF